MSKKSSKPAEMGGKKNAARKAGKKKKQQQTSTMKAELRNELKELSGVEARRDMLRIGAAGTLLIVTIFLFIAMVSNIFTGAEDQAGVLSESGMHFEASNKAGQLGAYVSYFLMQNFFGFGSLMIPVFLSSVIIKLMMRKACPFALWAVFVHSIIIMCLVSIDATFIQNNWIPEDWQRLFGFELGGLHGKELVGTVEDMVGSFTTFLLLLVLTLAYIGFWSSRVLIWIFKAFHKIIGPLLPAPADDGDAPEANDAGKAESRKQKKPAAATGDSPAPDVEWEIDGASATVTKDLDEERPDDEPQAQRDEQQTEQPMQEIEDDSDSVLSHEAVEGYFDLSIGSSAEDYEPIPTLGEELPIPPLDSQLPTAETEQSDELIINEGTVEEKAGTRTAESRDDAFLTPYDPRADLERYKFPPIDLLEKHSSSARPATAEELNANKDRIIEVLRNFGVEISKITATVGPTITLYEITPAAGVRIAKIRNLEDDIALSLSALGIRIIAPIPGKGTIGIEVPNKSPQVVSMESIVNTKRFQETKYELPIALGKTITNEMFMVDLAKMPHLLVAGATGQGKSVGLNAIITSLLYKKHPSELKIVMIDPKKVEFSMYNPLLRHFLAQTPDSDEPVVTDVKKVINTLKSLCQEMDDRYDLLKAARCRNIKEYNEKFCNRHLLPTEGHKYLPYIVVIIDEFGDLIMTAGKEIELPIARIAQLARAVGIHMVIATQSPRATIITGKIKANFPARMAFRVSQGIESQTILDRRGANNLIGRGDMLFQAGSELTRVQCAFVDTPEVVAIVKHIESQQACPEIFELPLVADDGSDGMEGISSQNGESTFEQVARFVVNTQMGSTSKIQRTFSVGFNRAGRLMDQLEEAGIVGPQQGSRPRQVLVQSEIELQQILSQLRANGVNFE